MNQKAQQDKDSHGKLGTFAGVFTPSILTILGIILYLAHSVSVAFSCIGFAEALSAILGPDFMLFSRIIAMPAVASIFLLAWLGSEVPQD